MRLYSVFPIAWSAFRMGYGYDRNSVVGEVVDNLVRESTKQHAPSAGLWIERANVRLSFNERRCFCHAVEEVSAQTRALLLVPAYSGSKLFASSGKGPNTSAHRPRRSRSIRRLATSQASSLAEPDSRAATRRLISAVQAEAASGSAGPSRLARSSEASSARPFKSRRSASARTVSVVFVMVPHILAPETAAQQAAAAARLIAGRCDGAERAALASSRVTVTCLRIGQVVATAAAPTQDRLQGSGSAIGSNGFRCGAPVGAM